MVSEKELMGASTGLLVLASLNGRPSYGYELLKRVNLEADGLFTWREGTLYPVLHRLEAEALVRAQWQDADDTGRRRKYYYITAKGRRSLETSSAQWDAFRALITRLSSATIGNRKPTTHGR